MKTGKQVVEAIMGSAVEMSLDIVKEALEDKALLAVFGVTESDQEAVEEAHERICTMMRAGTVTIRAA
jgi:hypothetical protein